jgi:hypothetical protein
MLSLLVNRRFGYWYLLFISSLQPTAAVFRLFFLFSARQSTVSYGCNAWEYRPIIASLANSKKMAAIRSSNFPKFKSATTKRQQNRQI